MTDNNRFSPPGNYGRSTKTSRALGWEGGEKKRKGKKKRRRELKKKGGKEEKTGGKNRGMPNKLNARCEQSVALPQGNDNNQNRDSLYSALTTKDDSDPKTTLQAVNQSINQSMNRNRSTWGDLGMDREVWRWSRAMICLGLWMELRPFFLFY
ncbi:uncharacterized protein BO95DRAFT_284556 [Aspergillus brunneoviolaceus CBS 621.78]|uniref:Uncharacterized protein n=1 Tax=Aspergillus brunneoviolaceus CBS 621.78 TaxID=1450534 RepID=A0ACD1GJT4_9EURO|nr:hypothetical protein BO95DRAFT_284556 [Aspergillus brunneoviolaceus CBS 621.78]RAH49435.1 hypothetical protein BO95DRAFT_284556 [Aspergillus brunneoviolaceus CBS 621.78]